MRKRKHFLLVLLLLLTALSFPVQALAASTAELSSSVRTAYDRVMSGAPEKLRSELLAQRESLEALALQDGELDEQLANLQQTNKDLLLSIQTRAKQFNSDQIAALEKEVTETKERYKPLFTLQTSLNKQIVVARKLKNKQLTDALQVQIDTVRLAAQLAREDIRGKEELYSKAKADKSRKTKELRTVLDGMETINARISAEKKSAVQTGKHITSGVKSLSSVVKEGAAERTLTSITSLNTLSSQLLNHKQNLIDLQKKNRSVLDKANAMVSAW